jgi:hypothetical protein
MLERLGKSFPRFAARATDFELEHIKPPLSLADIVGLEHQLGVVLPSSYKELLACTGGFWLMGGAIQFARPFLHAFEPFDCLTPQQQSMVKLKGGEWPPPTAGMLCFAEFFLEADGDQVLFDTRPRLIGEDYPVMYYAHEARPPSIRVLAATFAEFMDTFLEYPEFAFRASQE